MTPNIRFYFDGKAKTYRLQCVAVGCGADIWRYPHTLETRHLFALYQMAMVHVCGVAS